MTVISKTIPGSEYMYYKIDIYSVSKSKSQYICNLLNFQRWQLKKNEIWKVYDISNYDLQNTLALYQKLILRKGKLYLIKQ